MNAREYLNRINDSKRKIELLDAEIRRLKASAMGGAIEYKEKIQANSDPKQLETTVVTYVDKEELLERERARLFLITDMVIRTLEPLDRQAYEVLYRHYVMGQMLTDIAKTMNISYPTVKRAHARGLKGVSASLDGRRNIS